jgi:hypothetical protein
MDTQKQNEENSSKPTIVLVHGAVEDSSLWTHGVIQRLQRDGFPVKVFSNPLRGLFVDAAYGASQIPPRDPGHGIPVAMPTSRYQSAARSAVSNEKFANRCCK